MSLLDPSRLMVQPFAGPFGWLIMTIGLTFIGTIVYKNRSNAIGTRPRPDLKQPKGAVPLLGHLPLMVSIPNTELYDFFQRQNDELGPVWSISLPVIGRLIFGNSPEMLEYVLKTNFWNYEKGDLLRSMLQDILGRGFLLADGAEWKFLRKLTVQILNVNAFRMYTSEIFVQEGKKMLKHLAKAADEGSIIDIYGLLQCLTLDVFTAISVGESVGCLDDIETEVPFAATFDRLLGACADRMMDPTWKIREYLTGTRETIIRDKAVVRRHFLDVLEKRKQEQDKPRRKDLLQLIMECKDENGDPLSEDQILDVLFQNTIAGRDTTAEALGWMFYLILRDGADKNIVKQLEQEVDDLLHGAEPTYETHKQQEYAQACFNEALRIYPPNVRSMKRCVADDILPGGIPIYKGDWFVWNSYIMGRSEEIWGHDAKEFKPSRWINTEKPSPSKFNAFNVGPRTCPGQQFATVEALTIIAMIFQSFELSLVDPHKVPPYCISLTYPMAEGLPVRVARRAAKSREQ